MKRERLILYTTALAIVLLFATTGYVYVLRGNTEAILAEHETSPAAQHLVQIQEALRSPSAQNTNLADGKSRPVPAGTTPSPEADWPPHVPDGDPASETLLAPLRQAATVFTRVHVEITSTEEWDALYSDLFVRPFSHWSNADWDRLNAFLDEHGDLLAEIRAMAAGAGPLYPLDLSLGWATLLPHLAPTREISRLLQAEAVALSRKGDVVGAEADLMSGLQLAARVQGEPLIISQLVAMAIGSTVQEGVIAVFPEGRIPPELVARIAQYAHANAFAESIATAIRTEEGISLNFFEQIMNNSWQQGQRDFLELYAASTADRSDSWTGYLYTSPLARPWQHLDLQSYARIMGEFEPTLNLPFYEAIEHVEHLQQEVDTLPATRVLTRTMLPGLLSIHTAIARAEARQQIFLLGAAIESYAVEHGVLPERLEDVQGHAHGASIIDPFTGTPFQYNTNGNGFELYSVGQNLNDDGGRHDFNDGDIVWRGNPPPAPATANLVAQKV